MTYATKNITFHVIRCREENRPRVELGTKAWEPALHARARQVVRGGELGT